MKAMPLFEDVLHIAYKSTSGLLPLKGFLPAYILACSVKTPYVLIVSFIFFTGANQIFDMQ